MHVYLILNQLVVHSHPDFGHVPVYTIVPMEGLF